MSNVESWPFLFSGCSFWCSMENHHSHLRLDLIATDLSIYLLVEDLLKGFLDEEALL